MSRPVAVITGATSGLGRITALDLAHRGYRLGIVARSRSKAEALLGELREVVDDVQAVVFLADLSLISQARRVGKEVASYYGRLDVLVNNAGVHAFSQRTTAEGLAEMTAVNYLGPFALTQELTDRLLTPGAMRIVNVASEAARRAGSITPATDLRQTHPYTRRDSMALYGRTKLMTIMWTQELARRLDATKVTVNCCDPGFNATGLGRDLPGSTVLQCLLNTLRMGDPRRGAGIIVRLAIDPAFAHTSGGYFSVRGAKPLQCPEPGRSEHVQRELWSETMFLLRGMSGGSAAHT
ncbi:SDR family NAD(P)-dependent oxidoreductase [Streptomyces gibsoniae]|uniref:SDR family NAD(P)-dependent oxidoreductase n=1 Tax=Streptomyces gibsoniae TaxID=3075529 RepID=A0ABU2U2G5_9ACTN|nr:SDR family NAD(P)-dependent oxidoreductase [Streptomyces sp. DSM 41699]MDT0467251.1 SDR family NAD(P)-dependent oxidoreductase [Streptomyces sp. DSM 41699]